MFSNIALWWWWIVSWYGWPMKGVQPYFQPGLLSEILNHCESPTRREQGWTCAELELRLRGMKLGSSDNHYTTAPETVWNNLLSVIRYNLTKQNIKGFGPEMTHFLHLGHNKNWKTIQKQKQSFSPFFNACHQGKISEKPYQI